MQSTKIRLLAGVLLLVTASYAQAEALQPDPAWQQGKLANGFQWQILSTPQRPSDRVELRLIVNSGSLVEKPQQRGMSRLVSLLMVSPKDAQTRSLWAQSQDPDRPIAPAALSYNTTFFTLSLPNNRSDLLKEALKTLANTSGDLAITPETIQLAKLNTDRVETLPKATDDSWWRYRLKGSGLLEHDPAAELISPLNSEDVQAFYKQWYTPDAMTLIVVGNIDARGLSEQINKTFGELSGKREVPAPVAALAPLSHEAVSINTDSVTQDRLSIMWDSPWLPIRDSAALLNYWRADLAREALFSNLQQHLQSKNIKGINLGFDCRVIYQHAQCAINIDSPADRLNTNLALVGKELFNVKNNGLTQEEFDALIAQKKSELSQLFTTYGRMDTFMLMNQRVHSQQNQVVDIAPEQYQKLRQDFLNNLTLTMLNQDLRQQLSRDASLILLQPKGEPEYSMKTLQETWDKVMPSSSAPAITDGPKPDEPSLGHASEVTPTA